MFNKEPNNNKDFFLIKEIGCGKRKAGSWIADIKTDIYFDSDGLLFRLPKKALWKNEATLDDAELVKIPDGRVAGLMSFLNNLFLFCELNGKSKLNRLIKGKFEEIMEFDRSFMAWTLTEDQNAAFFLLSGENGHEIYSIDKDMRCKPFLVIPEKGMKLYGVTQADGYLYISGSMKGQGIIILVKIIDDSGHTFESCKTVYNIKTFPQELFKIAFSHKYSLLATLDGESEILTTDGKTVFKDIEPCESGYQIACLMSFKNKQDYIIAGSWRRSDSHPSACFYFLKNGKEIFKYIDDASIKDTGIWTGYDDRNGSYAGLEERYIPCYGSSIMAIKKIGPNSPLFFEQIRQASIAWADPETMLFVKLARNPFRKNQDARPRVDARTPANYAGYFLPAIPNKKTRFYITYDVEQHVPGKPYCLTGEGLKKPCGVYWIMDELEKYSLKGTFFVNIYDHVNFKDPVIETMIRDMHARGHEVGLHAHRNDPSLTPHQLPFYTKVLTDMSREEQRKVIKYGRDFIEAITGEAPQSFRAGSFRLNDTTLEVLEELGFSVDSSLCLNRMLPNLTFRSKNRPFRVSDGLLEMPLTVTGLFNRGEGDFKFSLVDINWHYNADELRHVIQTCREQGMNDLVFLGHSFSFIKFTNEKEKSPYDFKFTGNRYIFGEREDMMEEYDKFLAAIAANKELEPMLLRDAPKMPDIGKSSDIIPTTASSLITKNICPVCGSQVEFQPYGGRSRAMCPVCRSVERVRFKYLYLKYALGIENRSNYSILHIGPNLKIQEWLKSLPGIDHISADPFNSADLKFKIEEMPFKKNMFDMIICIAVLEHVLDDWKALEQMHKVLKTGGELLLYVGSLQRKYTLERYNRDEFPLMVAHDFHTPKDLDHPEVIRQNNVIYYNPSYTTREYGIDILDKIKEFGFNVNLIYAHELFQKPELYGLNPYQNLLSCIKI